ncbi:SLC13 family permease [Roseovarius aestuariivivens]|uniref:SLC13 family permease n=1 Tax=Roseovarius aestuariivivens TaxID=1888910 RepID=UPI001082170C|nr:SLC13 family permease [Roseovarius aestuariivivens]
MTQDQIALFAIFAVLFGLLIWGRIRFDLVAFAALLVAVLCGLVPAEDAFSGFGHHATIIVALVLVVSSGLVQAGAVQMITRTLIDSTRSVQAHIATMSGLSAALSGFINNVAALALLMPVDVETARKAGRAPGLTLMPLSFATILGGMVTLIGTPPNIIIASIREEELGESFAMFDFTPVGAITALAGVAFVALIGWRLMPARVCDQDSSAELRDTSVYLAELLVPQDNPIIGQTVGDVYDAGGDQDVDILGLIRDGKRRFGSARRTGIRAGDVLVLEATAEALEEFRSTHKLDYTDADRRDATRENADGLELLELVVPRDARIAGKTAQSIGLHWRHRTVVVGVSRQGRQIRNHLRRVKVQPGDILLLLTPKDDAINVADWLGCLPLAERGLFVIRQDKVWLAISLFAAAVFAATFGIVSLPIGLGCVVVAYLLTGVLPGNDLYRKVEWPVVVLLGSLIPLGTALKDTGGTDLLASQLLTLTEGLPAWAVLTALMVVTMTLSDVLNNTATSLVAAPVGIEMARTLGVSPDPFLMAVAVAASCAFLTPIGHKNNTLIMGAGGYQFGDYWRMGLPLELLVVAVSIPAILVFWPL